MARSDNCVNMHIKCIQWSSYCLIFHFGASKVNQTGDRSSDSWHVYSNPKNPIICPVIALAKYIFSNPDILATNSPLFPGNYQYDRFLKIFHKVIKENFDRFQSLGVEKGMIGAYFIIKGAITILDTVCTVSPPMA